jgi:hypothetical protein
MGVEAGKWGSFFGKINIFVGLKYVGYRCYGFSGGGLGFQSNLEVPCSFQSVCTVVEALT